MQDCLFSRRKFLKAAGTAAGSSLLPPPLRFGQRAVSAPAESRSQLGSLPDYTLPIAVKPIELARNRSISTTTYNGQFPGPLLRLKEGRRVTIDIHTQTDRPGQFTCTGK